MCKIVVKVEHGDDGNDQSDFPVYSYEFEQSKSLDEAKENVQRIESYDEFANINHHPHIYKNKANMKRPSCMLENGDLVLLSGGKEVILKSYDLGFGGYYDSIESIEIV